MVYRVAVDVEELPNEQVLQETATTIWEQSGTSYAEFTVFMYLPGMDTGGVAYAVGSFNQWGLSEFRLQEYGALGTKWWAQTEAAKESMPPTREGAVEYHLDVQVSLVDSLRIAVDAKTDFPDGTKLMVGVTRRFWEKGSSTTYAGEISTDDYPVVDGAIHVEVDVSDARWYAERKQKEREFAGLDIFGVIGRISPEVTVRVLFSPMRDQTPEILDVLGRSGERVEGSGVDRAGKIYVFEVEKSIVVPVTTK